VSLVPVPSEPPGATCAHCAAALVADQRYCLSCGQPASPVRLAFLDVLQSDQVASAPPPLRELSTVAYATRGEDAPGANGWLRRNAGLMSLLAVLVLCLIAGLLIGHWASQGKEAPAKQVVEVKGLSGLAATPVAATPAAASPSASAGRTKPTAKEDAEARRAEAKETAAEKAPPPKPKKVTPEKIKKLTTSSGAQHQKEINELGTQPIETG
jgi:hypothetical protein